MLRYANKRENQNVINFINFNSRQSKANIWKNGSY